MSRTTMRLHGTVSTLVDIEPIQVVQRLHELAVGVDNYIVMKNGKPHIACEEHRMEIVKDEPIPDEHYAYIQALVLVMERLKV